MKTTYYTQNSRHAGHALFRMETINCVVQCTLATTRTRTRTEYEYRHDGGNVRGGRQQRTYSYALHINARRGG